jgi:membrane associated rhomboid family serine protease
MPQLLPLLLMVPVFAIILAPALASASFLARRDRRKFMADGARIEATITRIFANPSSNSCRVTYSFRPPSAHLQVECSDDSTLAAVRLAGLREGSTTRVYYLPKRPRRAFIYVLAVAERVAALTNSASAALNGSSPEVYFVSYAAPAQSLRAIGALGGPATVGFGSTNLNAFRWTGPGDITITDSMVCFTATRARPLWFPRTVRQEFVRDAVVNVEVVENAVRCQIHEAAAKPKSVQFWTVNRADAKTIADRLPRTQTETFVPQLTEQAAFRKRLVEISPRAPATPTLIGLNVLVFLAVMLLGGGLVTPHAEVMIRFGTDYTPLVMSGQWWRFLTSVFLHFGFEHLAFNMLALWVFGVLAERLFGTSRYLLIYLFAGVAGSLTSFLWHPFVNGAGASGAIFGVLGSLLAFFLKGEQGVPKSVLTAQRNSAAIYIAYSLLNGARAGVDNAAHLGGLVAGLSLGFLLSRPLEHNRAEQSWTGQWMRAVAVIAIIATYVGMSLENGRLHPRLLQDAEGRTIPTAMLGPRLQSYAGITLGMTPQELLKAKGEPARRESANHWMYNSIDAAHDGLLDVWFTEAPKNYPSSVTAVLFWGDESAAPPGLPHLMGLTLDELTLQLGGPTYKPGSHPRGEYLGFRNGLVVLIESGKTSSYGIYADPSR